MFSRYNHIIWDWNGTLLNDVDLCVDLINTLLREQQLPVLSKEQYRNLFTFPVEKYYKDAGLDLVKFSFSELGRKWMDLYEARKMECILYDDSKVIIKKLAEKGKNQYVLSAYVQNNLLQLVKHFDLAKYFSSVSGLDHIYATSKIEIGKELLNSIGNFDHDILLIGDTLHDMEVANELGAECVLVASGHQSYEKLLTSGKKVYTSLTELMKDNF